MTAPDRQLDRVAALLDLNRPEQALEELGRLSGGVATSRQAFQLRAAALSALDRWYAVADVARQGLAETGPDAELFGRLGLALRHQGELAPAERALLDGLAIEPQHPWLLCQYADLCSAVGQTDKAARLLARAAELAPESPAVYAGRFQLAYARGDDREAERVAREFLGRWPEHPAALALYGSMASERGRVGEARHSFGRAVAQDPGDPDYAEAAWEARLYAHPLLVPLRPLFRLGVLRTWLIAVGTIAALNLAGLKGPAALVGLAWVLYCVYSWIAPPLVRRVVSRRWQR
ncbi:Tetratricopeptide repeat-containing protein [Micromonospora rhizosphaerae]|uniref:Tetratricopeptide repeat-containing protein n=1 Tax=Micromonospora rhizosphaerae TaxID=568872 RepID=A0A1C6RRK6_9ACTN|nr:tetratricopeptide repeat protein [Micromonospora rhizosphaerae]SCL19764.1 Tetratricopeptide repeat-containing protein [Micromonospora rhizosphaerae]